MAACADADIADLENYTEAHEYYELFVQEVVVINALITQESESAAGVVVSPSIIFHNRLLAIFENRNLILQERMSEHNHALAELNTNIERSIMITAPFAETATHQAIAAAEVAVM
jgi:hypothetical protein